MATKYAALGERIQQLRVAAGIVTQADLAHRLGASQQTISRWEAGTSRPRSEEVAKLAACFKVAPSELLKLSGYAPSTVTPRPVDQPLPLAGLPPESFEYFCHDFLTTLFRGQASVHLAGKTGHKQGGIDIHAQFNNGNVHTYQCKREAQFGPEKARKAITAQTVPATAKHILLSRVASPDARAAIREADGWAMWDQVDITQRFRTLSRNEQVRIVDIYFPTLRYSLTGEHAAGPWLTPEKFFAPHLVENRAFNQNWILVGRHVELDSIAAAFLKPDVIAVSLVGRAGEGKSRVLRAALDAFAKAHPAVDIVVASSTEEIAAKDLEDLGDRERLLVIDDAHDRSDLAQIVRHVAYPESKIRLLLVYRAYWRNMVQLIFGRYGLTANLVDEVVLNKPTRDDGIALATQVLTKYGASGNHAALIADALYDSPLAVVVGSQLVARENLHPDLFGNNAAFQSTVLRQYERVIADGIAQGKDRDRVDQVLRVIALIQPMIPDDKHVLELIANVAGIDAPDASHVLRLLVEGGVLFKRGAKYRLSPDLLADTIIESACLTPNGLSNGFAEKVFAKCISEHKEHLLLNLGRLDWRRNEGDTSKSTLLDGLWAQIGWEDDYVNASLKAAAGAAYFQPRQALALAQRLIDQGHGTDESVCSVIKGASYYPAFLPEACRLFWAIGQDDARRTNQHPSHAIRLLAELATPEPQKPIEFVDIVVDFALSLLDDPTSWTGSYTPFDILEGALTAEGHFTSAATRRAITITKYPVQIQRVKNVRRRIIRAMIASFASSNHKRAFIAANKLGEALRPPMSGAAGDDAEWTEEFVETLEATDRALGMPGVTAPVLVRVAESVHWHAVYGLERLQAIAQQTIALLNRDLETRTARAFMDAWGSNTWPIEKDTGRPLHESDVNALCQDLQSSHPNSADLAEFLDRVLGQIAEATGNQDYGQGQLFMGRILESNVPLARHVIQSYLRGETSRLLPHVGRALSGLMKYARSEASETITAMLASGDNHLGVLAETYYFGAVLGEFSEIDVEALKRLFSSTDKAVIWHLPQIAREVARSNPRFAIELTVSIDMEVALRHTSDFFLWIAHESTIPFELFRHDELRKLVDGLRYLTRHDDYWANRFLKKVLRKAPELVIDLAKARIDDAIATGDWGRSPLPRIHSGMESLGFMSIENARKMLRDLLDWGLSRVSDRTFTYHFSELFKAFCSPYDAAFLSVVEEWLSAGTEQHFMVATIILRDAGPSLIYENGEFVSRTLAAARALGRKVHRDLASAYVIAGSSGMRSGTPGQPFDADIRLKDLATRRLETLSKSDPAFELYTSLETFAAAQIERQLHEGRQMDEEEADG